MDEEKNEEEEEEGGRKEEEEEEKQQPLHHSNGSSSIVLDKCAEIGSWDLHALRCMAEDSVPTPVSGTLRDISHGPTEAR